jgi:hypothetical protein
MIVSKNHLYMATLLKRCPRNNKQLELLLKDLENLPDYVEVKWQDDKFIVICNYSWTIRTVETYFLEDIIETHYNFSTHRGFVRKFGYNKSTVANIRKLLK